ncbi:hypothetical protein LSCM1_00529 [Leishmania martiniquensis]|uniref:J domain-containing protein n=1 Tax=Leishmania martiniquensis TaxID=1580590 RepID=A0A836K9X7_9TRYP|nr:hypothetical protein LSCM1_00529 [Leishmania martiniquensis]
MFSRTICRYAPALEDIVAAFKVLGLTYNPSSPAASRPGVDDVRRQYREMARLHHPDLSSGDDNRMKVINTAYELIQSSGILQGAQSSAATPTEGAVRQQGNEAGSRTRFARKAGTRRRRLPDDFASGDDFSWSMKTSLDWQAIMNSTDTITEEEMKNPANHPFSHSKFFTFEEDLTIYRMIRGGATVRQVARTLGKPATFLERRLQNAQFKLRVQYVLRHERRKPSEASSNGGASWDSLKHTTSTPISEPATRRALRRSPFEDTHDTAAAAACTSPMRKREWEPSYPEWRAPRHHAQMTLEEQGRLDGLLRETPCAARTASRRVATPDSARQRAASKMGRSYENYKRLQSKSFEKKAA